MELTLRAHGWPAGTTVDFWPSQATVEQGGVATPPPSPPISSATVAADGTLTVAGLEGALLDGYAEGRRVSCAIPRRAPTAPGVTRDSFQPRLPGTLAVTTGAARLPLPFDLTLEKEFLPCRQASRPERRRCPSHGLLR
jgi:hypothetical protein